MEVRPEPLESGLSLECGPVEHSRKYLKNVLNKSQSKLHLFHYAVLLLNSYFVISAVIILLLIYWIWWTTTNWNFIRLIFRSSIGHPRNFLAWSFFIALFYIALAIYGVCWKKITTDRRRYIGYGIIVGCEITSIILIISGAVVASKTSSLAHDRLIESFVLDYNGDSASTDDWKSNTWAEAQYQLGCCGVTVKDGFLNYFDLKLSPESYFNLTITNSDNNEVRGAAYWRDTTSPDDRTWPLSCCTVNQTNNIINPTACQDVNILEPGNFRYRKGCAELVEHTVNMKFIGVVVLAVINVFLQVIYINLIKKVNMYDEEVTKTKCLLNQANVRKSELQLTNRAGDDASSEENTKFERPQIRFTQMYADARKSSARSSTRSRLLMTLQNMPLDE